MLSERGKESPDSRSDFLKIEMLITNNTGAESSQSNELIKKMDLKIQT